MMYLHETKLAMLIDADAVPVSHRRPYGDIDIRYPWKSDDQRAAEVVTEILPFKTEAAINDLTPWIKSYRAAVDAAMGVAAARVDRLAELALQRAHIHAAERATRPPAVVRMYENIGHGEFRGC